LLVLNKIDKIDPARLAVITAQTDGIPICALNREGFLPLLKAMEAHIWREIAASATVTTG
jgi:50S ribosomal subunit-associated GTPase HflX